ncbi:HAD-IIB family hydrolase [Paenibacillus sp. TY11]|uniref:HAD-IIB family hydrolase n=1 Tax=Paenibacillus sp. TY11 TaxID=3448633 RepID=UPI004039C911
MNFVFDLDGTICFKGQPLDEQVCHALDECIKQGHEVIFASARPIRDLLPILPKEYHHFRMVGGNGAFTYADQQIGVTYFSKEIQAQLVEITQAHNLRYLADSDWNYSYTGDEHHSIYRNIDPLKKASNKQLNQLNGISKMVMFSPTDEVKDLLQLMNVSLFEHHTEVLIDISPPGIDKAKGLNQLGITEYVAFGNDTNDRVLFEQAIYSVCVGNHPVSIYANETVTPANAASRIQELAYQYG